MVKGISRQVIVVNAPEPKLFEQAIFILKDDALKNGGVSNEELLLEAKKLMNNHRKRKNHLYGPVWAAGGALLIGAAWILSMFL